MAWSCCTVRRRRNDGARVLCAAVCNQAPQMRIVGALGWIPLVCEVERWTATWRSIGPSI